MPSPREIIISLTNRCNCKCRMCDIPAEKAEELPFDFWKCVIKDASRLGAGAIIFSGGEPLLREDIFDLIRCAKENSLSACLTSNGLLLDEAVARKLRDVKVDVVNISVEGPRSVHDYLRGKGMFEKAVRALVNLRNNRIESTVATLVCRDNYKHLAYAVKLAKQCHAATIKFQPFSHIFLSSKERNNTFSLTEKEANSLGCVLQEVAALCLRYRIATNPTGYLKMIPFYLSKRYIGPKNGCAALEVSCPINCKGEMYPCWSLTEEHYLIGNVNTESVSGLWGSQRRKTLIERIQTQGCPGCVMSCYDQNFGSRTVDTRIIMNLSLLRKRGVREYLKHKAVHFKRRIMFYASYKGSLKGLVRRFSYFLKKKDTKRLQCSREDSDKVLIEIDRALQMLKNEL